MHGAHHNAGTMSRGNPEGPYELANDPCSAQLRRESRSGEGLEHRAAPHRA